MSWGSGGGGGRGRSLGLMFEDPGPTHPSSTNTAPLIPTNKFTNLTLLQILHTDTLIR